MGSRGCALLLLGAALPLLGSAAVSPERSLAWGPGLEAGLALPVRYFYIQAVSATGRNFSRSPPGTVRVLGAALRAARPARGGGSARKRSEPLAVSSRPLPSPPRCAARPGPAALLVAQFAAVLEPSTGIAVPRAQVLKHSPRPCTR